MSHLPWYKANPYFLEREKDALAAIGVEFELDSAADSQGIVRISLVIETSNPNFELQGISGPLRLEAVFPDNYPFFRPEVYADGVDLPRHQNPFGKNLCLLPRPTGHWDVEWTLASYLQSQLPKVLNKGAVTDPSQIVADPHEQAEPVSEYYADPLHPIVFDSTGFDSLATPPAEVTYLGRFKVGLPDKASLPSRMAVLEAYDSQSNPMGKLPISLAKQFPVKFEGVLLRLGQRPPTADAFQYLEWLINWVGKQKGSLTLQRRPVPLKNGINITHVIGLNFPEEVGPGAMGMGWLFLVVGTIDEQVAIPNKKQQIRKRIIAYYSKVARVGSGDLQIRVPNLLGLNQAKISIVGLGALGAPAAIEFARNQVGELRLMDFDIVEPGPTVRWPLGLPVSGQLKTEAISNFISEHYPKTQVKQFQHKLGSLRAIGSSEEGEFRTEQQVMEEFLEGTSLLFDASAESGVSHFLSEEAKRRGIPYLCIHATPGAWGGLVMRVLPDKTEGCWMCMKHWQFDGDMPVPIKDEAGEIQAAGCGNLTFTGAGFDLQNTALAGVRLAVSTLLSGTPGGYPEARWDVGVLSLMDEAQCLIAPTWETFPLKRHPKCSYCSSE